MTQPYTVIVMFGVFKLIFVIYIIAMVLYLHDSDGTVLALLQTHNIVSPSAQNSAAV